MNMRYLPFLNKGSLVLLFVSIVGVPKDVCYARQMNTVWQLSHRDGLPLSIRDFLQKERSCMLLLNTVWRLRLQGGTACFFCTVLSSHLPRLAHSSHNLLGEF